MKSIIPFFLFLPISLMAQKNALNFDGVNDYVNLNSVAPTLANKTNFSVEFWMQAMTQKQEYAVLFSINGEHSSGDINKLIIRISGSEEGIYNTITVNAPYYGDQKIIGSTNVLNNRCHHVAYTYNNGVHTLYVDGILEGTMTKTIHLYASDRYNLGQEFDVEGTSQFYTGMIDDVRIWNKIRTQNEIENDRFFELNGNENDLLAYYNFNQGVAGGNNKSITTLNNLVNTSQKGTLIGFDLSSTTSNFTSANCVFETLAVKKEIPLFNFTLFPNPTQNFIEVSGINEKCTATVFDVNGRLIFTKTINNSDKRINVESLNNGVYLLQIETESNQVKTRKFIVNK
ncbi:MAG TPA: T9SS type A sorting domain-containing protein [Crocinitomicaceae bacterium]|nr:T9SS type A sorting domain-containing protein [Crocinitomicaceae bacterium]